MSGAMFNKASLPAPLYTFTDLRTVLKLPWSTIGGCAAITSVCLSKQWVVDGRLLEAHAGKVDAGCKLLRPREARLFEMMLAMDRQREPQSCPSN
jgi:hypothetical protein